MADHTLSDRILEIRKDFPILNEKVYGKDLVYLDNGATTQKPVQVIQSLVDYYSHYNSNVHRGVHFLSQKATDAMEESRQLIASYINAAMPEEIVFTKGTTDGINMIAHAFGKAFIKADDEIIVSQMEHHSNLVPWQLVAEERKAILRFIPLREDGTIETDALEHLISDKTKIIALTWVSNTLGTVNPIREIIAKAHATNIPVCIDAAQAVQHIPVDVQAMDIDFLVASGHKIYGPTGIGFLYGKEKWLKALPPYQGGGSMIKTVKLEQSAYADPPFRFEAGTPNIAGAIGLGAAIRYVNQIGISFIEEHEAAVMQYATDMLKQNPRIHILGDPPKRSGAISMTFKGAHPYDVGELLDKQGIAVRTGHHCCQPIMDFYDIPGTLRISFGLYNTEQEIDRLAAALDKALSML